MVLFAVVLALAAAVFPARLNAPGSASVATRRGHEAGVSASPPIRKDVAPAAAPAAASSAELTGPAVVARLEVPRDQPAAIVWGPHGAKPHTVFVPGLCSNASAYLQGFPEAARAHGGVIGIEGDQPCAPGFRSFSWDAAKLDARIEAALAAAEIEPSGRESLTLVGYSQGAALAEQLVQRWPRRYARFVLIGAPTDPAALHFRSAEAVVTMSCSRDVPARMREAARRMQQAKLAATYMEMPGCTHGNLADGDRVLGAAFDWLESRAPAP